MENFVDQARFSRSGHTGDADQQSKWNFHVDIFQIIDLSAFDLDRALRQRFAIAGRKRNDLALAQVSSGKRVRIAKQRLIRAGEHDLAALLARFWTEVED